MKSQNYLLIMIISFIKIQTVWAYSDKLNQRFTHATDASPRHSFLSNPASFYSDNMQMEIFSIRSRSDTQFIQEGNNPSTQKTRAELSFIGINFLADLGSGMWAGFQYNEQSSDSDSNLNILSFRDISESTQSQSAKAVITVELAENIYFGFNLENVSSKYDVVGSYFLDPDDFRTTYSTRLIGSSTGLSIGFQPFSLSLTYIPVLKGKTEILGEEFIATKPGHSDISLAVDVSDGWKVGFLYRRQIYKKDDRFLGTTANDEDQTQLSPFGVWVMDTMVFPISTISVGAEYKINKLGFALLSYETITYEFNNTPDSQTPGENSEAISDKVKRLKGLLVLHQGNLDINICYNKSSSSLNFSENSNIRTFEFKEQEFWLGLRTIL